MSFPLSILQMLIQGSLVWEDHIIRKSSCYIDIWEYAYPFLTSSLGFLSLRSEHVYLYVCKKKWKWKINRRICVLFSIIEHVYWCSRVIWLIMFVDKSSYVSFPRPFILCIHFCHMFWEWDEWPSLKSFKSLSIPSLYSLLTCPPFIFDLSRSSLVLIFYASSSSLFSLLTHHF